jgi:iron complex transport system substrate-binding protein
MDALPEAKWPTEAVGEPRTNLPSACVSDYQPGVDYFPDKVSVTRAHAFKVSYHGHFKIIDFVPDVGTHEEVRYVLVQCGTPVPTGLGRVRVVQVPIARFVLTNMELLSLVQQLGIVDQLVGIANINRVSNPDIIDRYSRGVIRAVGGGTHSAIEMTIAVDPDVVFTFYSAFADSNTHPKLWDIGITGVPVADHFETTPLGRAEWMKFIALFFNKEAVASAEFDAVERDYLALAAKTAGIEPKPPVLLGWRSTRTEWALSGGRNYFARLIEDAGGRYVWDSDSSRSLDLIGMEQVYSIADGAVEWIGNQLGFRTLPAMIANDPRVRYFGPVERKSVHDNDVGKLPSGAYPFFDDNFGHPERVLADLIRILHPSVLPEHGLRYYRELKE